MDRAYYEEMLEQSERHVSLGEQHIARQREIIAELERDGHETDLAYELLARYEELLSEHLAHRDRLRAGLRAILPRPDLPYLDADVVVLRRSTRPAVKPLE